MLRRRKETIRKPSKQARPKLRATLIPTYKVHHRDLEQYLFQVYGVQDYDVLLAAHITPGVTMEFQVSDCTPPTGAMRQRADELRAGRRVSSLAVVLSTLAVDRYIPPGKYVITTEPAPLPIDEYRELLTLHGTPDAEECINFKNRHQRDRNFMKHAATIDAGWRSTQ